jgi:hypothetical protein
MDITFLYWEDCPSHEEALQRLRQIMTEEGIQAPVRLINVETWEQAEQLQFIGSPTILVNGKDIQPPPPGASYMNSDLGGEDLAEPRHRLRFRHQSSRVGRGDGDELQADRGDVGVVPDGDVVEGHRWVAKVQMIDREPGRTIGHSDQAAPGIPGESPEEGGAVGRKRARLDQGDLRPAHEPRLQPRWHGGRSAERAFPGLLGWGGHCIGDARSWRSRGDQPDVIEEIGAPGSRRGTGMNPQEQRAQMSPLVNPRHQVQWDHHLLPAVGDACHAKATRLDHARERWVRMHKAHLECGSKAVRGVSLDPEDARVIRTRVDIGQGEMHAQFGGLGMQTGMREGKGGTGKPVPEMQRVAVHHLRRGAG